MDVARDPYQGMIDELLAFGDLKVWSVLVTIFGDLAARRGSYLPGPYLSAITTELGIRPEAQRVALHRLRKDGWIEVEKDGRVSRYGLSALARRETKAVQSRVFDATVPRPVRAHLILRDPEADAGPDAGWLSLGAGVYLSDRAPLPALGDLVSGVAVADLPDWVRRCAIPADIQATYAALAELLRAEVNPALIPADKRLALRLLILHRWRRLVLSHSRQAANVMGEDWLGNTCRDRVQRWLRDLPRPGRAEIAGV